MLEYGIGVKIEGVEQFRMIYKGKAHKCIITDLMPKTTFRLRVMPLHKVDGMDAVQGEWSEIAYVTTRDKMFVDVTGNLATLKNRFIQFDKPGILGTNYGYSFGEHLWLAHVKLAQGSDQASISLGVINKRFSNTVKLLGVSLSLTTSIKTEQTVRLLLDANKKTLTIWTNNE